MLPGGLPRKILMLHGYTQSGPLFQAKTSQLEKALRKAFPSVQLEYPTAPINVPASAFPGHDSPEPSTDSTLAEDGGSASTDAWGWWRANELHGEYDGLEQGLAHIASYLRSHGPFDGLVGFSQGAAAAAIVASLLELGRREAIGAAKLVGADSMAYSEAFVGLEHPPLRFFVSYSGFHAGWKPYAGFYEPRLGTPSLHFIGSLDTVVEESWSRQLVDACGPATTSVVLHPGGHFVPSGKRDLAVIVDFIRQVCSRNEKSREGAASTAEEDDVLNMDVPF